MANEEIVFQRGETVPVYAETTIKRTGALVDPTTIKIDIYDKNELLVVDAQDMTQLESGDYVYYFNTDSNTLLGWYRTVITGVDGTGAGAKTTIKEGGFELQ